MVLNPDQQMRQVFVHFFESFKRIGSALRVVKAFRKELIKFPTRCRKGPRKGQLVWGELTHSQALKVLHQPRYAGAFCYGRTRTRRAPDGRRVHETLPRDRWSVLIKEAHQGYINWNQYEGNLRRLRENARAYGKERRRSPAGQGPALLQGLAICARCGRRMTVNYHSRAKRLIPHYLCQREGIEQGHKPCQRIPGEKIDQAVSDLLLKTLNRHNLTVQVHEEIQRRKEEADRLRHEQVQRARYEADLAQRRYLQVDPNNRLVADVLEAEWNRGLEELTEAQRQYEEQRKRDQETLGEAAKKQIVALTRQFPKIWNDPQTLHRDRKRVLRLIIEDVTLLKDEAISLHVRFKGGATRTLDLPAPLGAAQLRKTDPQVVKQIDALLEQHTEAEAAEILNQHGLRSAIGLSFDRLKVKRIRNAYALKNRYHRLREKGLLTHREVAQLIGIDPTQINHWRKRGLLQAERANDKNDYLFGRPDAQTLEQIRKRTRSKKPERSHCLSHT